MLKPCFFLPQPPEALSLEDRLRAAEPAPKKKKKKKKQPAEIGLVRGVHQGERRIVAWHSQSVCGMSSLLVGFEQSGRLSTVLHARPIAVKIASLISSSSEAQPLPTDMYVSDHSSLAWHVQSIEQETEASFPDRLRKMILTSKAELLQDVSD
jgi:hypothetical protein